ncbi:MAG: hypothetical protein LBC13_01100 [Clostridiales bacterium]|jgi:DNA polymerase-3 subunit delta'|nr:hypothetical protein [Clostridiales bacterium]
MDLNEFYNGILKNSRVFSRLQADFASGRPGHAYLVVSEDSDALKRLLVITAAAAYCPEHGCLDCGICLRVLHGNNPDVYMLNYGGDKINVDKIIEITAEANLKSFSGGRRLFLIFRADLINEAAQNKLLKTLEEPPADISFILGAASESKLLSTLKSRVRKLYLDLFPEELLTEALAGYGVDKNRARLAAACSGGLITRALEIALNDDFNAAHLKALRVLKTVRRPADAVHFVFDKSFTSDADEFLNALAILLRDVMLFDSAHGLVALKSDTAEIARLAKEYSPEACASAIRAVNSAKERLFFNVSAAAALEPLFFEIARLKTKV